MFQKQSSGWECIYGGTQKTIISKINLIPWDELLENMEDALNLYLDEPEDSKIDFPLPKQRIKKTSTTVEIPVNSKVAFALLLRHARHEKNLTQSKMAKLLNYSSVFSYQKLESSKSANPTLVKVQKLQEDLPN